ncbi:MFS general substrate transporter [Backusella circina FSU 941]|nr:MFS general substrate transporter [Backusella circina FSU 941]
MIPRLSPNSIYSISFITALFVANISGPQYIYPTFGTSLNERFGWSAFENSIVSTACFIGVSFSGPLCSWMIENLGITKTLRVSACLAFSGLFLLAQTYAGRLPGTSGLCAFYLICTGIAGASAYLCALQSQSQNFKQRRGLSMGLTTASVGMCGFVFSQINDGWFGPEKFNNGDSTYHFLLFLAIVMSFGFLMGSFILGPIRRKTVIYQQVGDDEEGYAMRDRHDPEEEEEEEEDGEVSISGMKFLTHPIGSALFCTMFVVLGTGYVYLANIGQILLALTKSSDQHVRNVHTTLFSLGNCFSRAFFGALSDILKNRFNVHRLWVFLYAVVAVVLTLGYLVTGVKDADDLFVCTLVISMTYGIGFGVAPAVTTEFGSKLFTRNWGWLLFAPAFGSQLLNFLFGSVYGHETARQGGDHLCEGAICFRETFRVAIVSGVISIFAICLAIYKTGIYRQNPVDNKLN